MNASNELDFMNRLMPGSIAIQIFEDTPEILFWIKDENLRLVHVNETFSQWVNLPKDQIIGRTDQDFYYTDLAILFMKDDAKVIRTGEAIRNKAELCTNRYGGAEWRLTSKFPITDQEGIVIGTSGISKPLQRENIQNIPQHYWKFTEILDYVRGHMGKGISVKSIATFTNTTVSTLERRFRQYLGITPHQFLLEIKMSAAAKMLLNSPLLIADISERVGYENKTSFTRAFTKYIGTSPSQFRKQHTKTGHGNETS